MARAGLSTCNPSRRRVLELPLGVVTLATGCPTSESVVVPVARSVLWSPVLLTLAAQALPVRRVFNAVLFARVLADADVPRAAESASATLMVRAGLARSCRRSTVAVVACAAGDSSIAAVDRT
jgi:hypothetical protein